MKAYPPAYARPHAFMLKLLAFILGLLAFMLGLLAFMLGLLAFILKLLAFMLKLLAFIHRSVDSSGTLYVSPALAPRCDVDKFYGFVILLGSQASRLLRSADSLIR